MPRSKSRRERNRRKRRERREKARQAKGCSRGRKTLPVWVSGATEEEQRWAVEIISAYRREIAPVLERGNPEAGLVPPVRQSGHQVRLPDLRRLLGEVAHRLGSTVSSLSNRIMDRLAGCELVGQETVEVSPTAYIQLLDEEDRILNQLMQETDEGEKRRLEDELKVLKQRRAELLKS